MFAVWCCRGNPDGLFDFHLSASHCFSPLLPAVWSQALSTCETEAVYFMCLLLSQLSALRNKCVNPCFFFKHRCHLLRFLCSLLSLVKAMLGHGFGTLLLKSFLLSHSLDWRHVKYWEFTFCTNSTALWSFSVYTYLNILRAGLWAEWVHHWEFWNYIQLGCCQRKTHPSQYIYCTCMCWHCCVFDCMLSES